MKGSRNAPDAGSPSRGAWAQRFVLQVMAWLIPAAVLWVVLTPFYNRFLTVSVENLVRLFERPAATRLAVQETHYLVITRNDYSLRDKPWLASIRTSDTHFPLIMMGALFLAVPGVSWRKRFENLGWALLIAVFFHILSLAVRVQFVYATQLAGWSAENYGALARNVWGMSSHLLEIPFKFGLPFALWAAFYIKLLLPPRGEQPVRA